MVKLKLVGSVVLALVAIALVAFAERRFHLPQSVSFGALMLLTQVLVYPVVEWWYEKRDRRITFKKWAQGAIVSSVSAALIYTMFVRFFGAPS